MSSFIKRTVSGAILLLITIACIYFKGIPLVIYSFLIAAFSFYELINTLKVENRDLIIIGSLFFIGFTMYAVKNENLILILTLISVYVFLSFFIYLFNRKLNLEFAEKLIFSYIYIILPMGIFLNLGYKNALWVVFMISWGTDTFAYIFGIIFGKHKLLPNVSPKKTIEGSIGGVFGAILMCSIVNRLFFDNNFISIVLLAIIGSVFAQIGDLFASRIKREYKIKDFSDLILGHGGILDRYDSILFVTPVVYIALNLFGGF